MESYPTDGKHVRMINLVALAKSAPVVDYDLTAKVIHLHLTSGGLIVVKDAAENLYNILRGYFTHVHVTHLADRKVEIVW